MVDWRFCSTARNYCSEVSIMSKGDISVLPVLTLHQVVTLAAASQ